MSGVGVTINMSDKLTATGVTTTSTLTENMATEINYDGEEQHEITIGCDFTNASGKNIEVNYRMMHTYRNGQMAPVAVNKDYLNQGTFVVNLGRPAMYNSEKFIIKEIEVYIVLTEKPSPNGILRAKDENMDNTFLFSWKEQFKKVMENKFETKPLDWDFDAWWLEFSNTVRCGYDVNGDNENLDWEGEEDYFELWKCFFLRFQDFVPTNVVDLKVPIKWAWDTFSDWSQEKVLQAFGFTRSTYDWFTRYKSWRWGTRRISANATVQCSDTRLTQHQEWRWDSDVMRMFNDVKDGLKCYVALKGSTIKVIADEGYRVGSIIFRDTDGDLPGCIEFTNGNNGGQYYKSAAWWRGRQLEVEFSNFNGPSSEVTLTVTKDFYFPEMEVTLLKENYSEFEQAIYEVKTAEYSLLKLTNYPSDYPLASGTNIHDFHSFITYSADDNSYFTGTFDNAGQDIEGYLSAAGPSLRMNNDYMFPRSDWGNAVVCPVKEGETNIWASMEAAYGYAYMPNIAQTHLVIRGRDPQLHFANYVAHVKKLATELPAAGPELYRNTGTVDATVTFNSSDPQVVTVTKNSNSSHTLNWAGGYGTVVISATQPAKDKYTIGYASYELTVQKPLQESFLQVVGPNGETIRGLENLSYGDTYLPVFELKDFINGHDYYLQEGRDYVVTYKNKAYPYTETTTAPRENGTYELRITGRDIYTGTISREFTIAALDMATSGHTLEILSDVHDRTHYPKFNLYKDGQKIESVGIQGDGGYYQYHMSFSKVMNQWRPGDHITLTITPNPEMVTNVSGSLSAEFYYSYYGEGTVSRPYEIGNVEQFNYLSQEVNGGNDMTGKCFKLTGNIDGTSTELSTIGSLDHPFAGRFDGDSKLIINPTKAVFGRVKGTVLNFFIIGSTSETGAIALWNEGTLLNNFFQAPNVSLPGVVGNNGNIENNGATRIYKVSYNSADMSCHIANGGTQPKAQNGIDNYFADGANVKTYLSKNGHESDVAEFYLSNGGELTACNDEYYLEGSHGNYQFTINSSDVYVDVAFQTYVKSSMITLAESSFEYDGTAKTPTVTLEGLTEGTDFTVSYENNTNAGMAKVVVTGMGGYTGQAEKTFTISPRTDVEVGETADWYEVGITPEPTVTCTGLGTTLVKDQDYVLRCNDNRTPTLPGDPLSTVTIKFIGNYSGQKVREFKVHYWQGEGTAENPYQITNSRQLCYLSQLLNESYPTVSFLEAYYQVTDDIDMAGVSFRPISDRFAGENYQFYGTFDGNNKVISNLTISEGTNETGFFGRNYAGTLKNIILKDVTTTVNDATKPTALLVGANQSTVNNCVVLGTLPADSKVKNAITEFSNERMTNNYYHINGNDAVRGTFTGDDLTNDAAVGLFNFTTDEDVTASNVTYANTYPLFGTDYHKNGSTATMTLVYSGALTNPMFYAEDGDLVDNGDDTYTLTFDGPARIIATTGLPMADAEITLSETEYTFVPERTEGFEPTVTVTYDGKQLTEGEDYEVAYSDNLNAGSATVTVTGKKMYTGSKNEFFSIAPYDFATAGDDVSVGIATIDEDSQDNYGHYYYNIGFIPNILFDGENTVKPSIGVRYFKYLGYGNGNYWDMLVEDQDYTVAYTKADEVGTAYVTVTGKGNYTGSITEEYTITDQDFTKCTVTSVDIPYSNSYVYYNLSKAFKVTSPYGEMLKSMEEDWENGSWQLASDKGMRMPSDESGTPTEVDLIDALPAGEYQVELQGTGMWSGTKTVTFNIVENPSLTLYDAQDNKNTLELYGYQTVPAVTFKDRVLYKDGDWNTICLPFNLSLQEIADSPLAGCTIMEMDGNGKYNDAGEPDENGTHQTSFDATTGTLSLYFRKVFHIDGGTPYLIKWNEPDKYVAYDGTNAATCSDIVEPVFESVYVIGYASQTYCDDGTVTFRGTVDPLYLYDNPHTRYYLGVGNQLFYPKNSFVQFGAFRGYFEIDLGDNTDGVRTLNINFAEDDAQGITSISRSDDDNTVWFDLNGSRLSGKPTARGIYINNGHKIVIK